MGFMTILPLTGKKPKMLVVIGISFKQIKLYISYHRTNILFVYITSLKRLVDEKRENHALNGYFYMITH